MPRGTELQTNDKEGDSHSLLGGCKARPPQNVSLSLELGFAGMIFLIVLTRGSVSARSIKKHRRAMLPVAGGMSRHVSPDQVQMFPKGPEYPNMKYQRFLYSTSQLCLHG